MITVPGTVTDRLLFSGQPMGVSRSTVNLSGDLTWEFERHRVRTLNHATSFFKLLRRPEELI